MKRYKIANPEYDIIAQIEADGSSYFSFVGSANPVYQQWLAEGNQPDPPDARPEPVAVITTDERIEALETMLSMVLDQEVSI